MTDQTTDITWIGLAWTLLLVAVALAISYWQRLGLEQRLIVGCLRAALQLIIIGYVLGWIINGQQLWVVLLAIALQMALAAWTVGSLQSPPLRGSRQIALVSLLPA